MTDLKSKNILYITHSYNNFIKFQVEKLSKEFNNVYVIVRHKPIAQLWKIFNNQGLRANSLEYKIDTSNIPQNVKVYTAPLFYIPLSIFNYIFYKYLDIQHTFQVERIIKKEKLNFDLIHAHILTSAGQVGVNISKKYNKPLVVTGHGSEVVIKPFLDNYWKRETLKVLNNSKAVITVSKANSEKMRELGFDREINVITNGFDKERVLNIDKMRVREELGLPKDKKILVTIANCEKVKGHKYLIEAIKELTKERNDLYFVFVGGGTIFSRLNNEVSTLGLEDTILMTNFQPFDMVSKYLRASDFAVQPSLSEGVPTTLFEYMGNGLPYVATKVGGIPEVSSEGNSILINPGSSEELIDAIKEMVKKQWDRGLILEISENYTWDKICDKIAQIYRKVLA